MMASSKFYFSSLQLRTERKNWSGQTGENNHGIFNECQKVFMYALVLQFEQDNFDFYESSVSK